MLELIAQVMKKNPLASREDHKALIEAAIPDTKSNELFQKTFDIVYDSLDILEGFKKIIRVFLKRYPGEGMKEIKAKIEIMTPNFKQDETFQDAYCDLYRLVKSEMTQENEKMPLNVNELYPSILQPHLDVLDTYYIDEEKTEHHCVQVAWIHDASPGAGGFLPYFTEYKQDLKNAKARFEQKFKGQAGYSQVNVRWDDYQSPVVTFLKK